MIGWQNLPRYQMLSSYNAPVGWAGQWPPVAPPPLPPAPPGVDPSRWQTGQWRFNPRFQPSAAITMQSWMAHPSWGPAVASYNNNYNPYKRIPNPGDAQYWATKLSDNPLGLTNMVTAEELEKRKKQHEEQQAHTPWVWVPKDLEDPEAAVVGQSSGNEQPQSQNAHRSEQPSRHQHTNHHSHHHRPIQDQPVSSASDQWERTQQWARTQQQRAQPQPPSTATVVPPRPDGGVSNQASFHSNSRESQDRTQPPSSAPAAVSTYAQYTEQQRRHATAPESQQLAVDAEDSQAQGRSQTADNTHISRRKLEPTFSPRIVRTPDHYLSSASAAAATGDPSPSSHRLSRDDSIGAAPKRRSSKRDREGAHRSPSRRRHRDRPSDSDDDSPPPGPHAHGRIYGPPTPTPTRTTSNEASSSTHPTALSNAMSSLSVSTPAAASSTTDAGVFLSTFSEEPLDLLSPLVVNAPPPKTPDRSSRDLSRSQTYPSLSASAQSSPFPTIPEEQPSDSRLSRTSSTRTPKRSPSQYPQPQSQPRTPNSLARSQTYPALDNGSVSPVIPPYPSNATHTPPRGAEYGYSRNPLPPPPKDVISSMPTSTSTQPPQSYYNHTGPSPQRHHAPEPASRSHSYPSSAFTSSASQAHGLSSASAAAQGRSATYAPVLKRRGYWNRRGDHLVQIGAPASERTSGSPPKERHYIVYAPREQANPEDLSSYPVPTDGWMDHRGRTIKYDPTVPELPESLPQRGEPPVRPYQSFVQYTYV